MLSISDSTIRQLADLSESLRTRALFDESVRWELNHEYRRRAIEKMLATGATYGEANVAPGTVSVTRDEGEFREKLRAIDNELADQVRVVAEGIEAFFSHGEWPAPYYAWRVGIILRKAKQVRLEADFLEAWALHFRGGPGARYQAIASRAVKARQLADGKP